MSGSNPGPSEPVAARTALVFALVAFVALLIFGLGVTSLLTSSDVVAVPGLGELPGVLAAVVGVAGFVSALWAGIRRGRPSYGAAVLTAFAAFLAYVLGAALGALFSGHGIAAALAVVGALVTRWYGIVVFVAALIAACGAVALMRSRSGRPRWPWESDE